MLKSKIGSNRGIPGEKSRVFVSASGCFSRPPRCSRNEARRFGWNPPPPRLLSFRGRWKFNIPDTAHCHAGWLAWGGVAWARHSIRASSEAFVPRKRRHDGSERCTIVEFRTHRRGSSLQRPRDVHQAVYHQCPPRSAGRLRHLRNVLQ